MPDANDFVRAIKQAAKDANDAGYPANVMTGTVTALSPITVMVEQRFSIGKAQLIVPEHLTDYEVSLSLKGQTDGAGEPEHQHGYGEKQTAVIHNGLKQGDHVVLLRQQGGQKYLILDRVV